MSEANAGYGDPNCDDAFRKDPAHRETQNSAQYARRSASGDARNFSKMPKKEWIVADRQRGPRIVGHLAEQISPSEHNSEIRSERSATCGMGQFRRFLC